MGALLYRATHRVLYYNTYKDGSEQVHRFVADVVPPVTTLPPAVAVSCDKCYDGTLAVLFYFV